MWAPRTDIETDIMIYALDTGAETRCLRVRGRAEAPNWMPDGSGLLVNQSGRLWSLRFGSSELERVPTGFAARLNNDHGPSPDGQIIALSDKTETGQSVIYTMPTKGGTPVRVTPHPGSYFHAWSPDGARLAYTARREGRFQIATCARDGSDEQILTDDSFDHSDGPDYTPDGRWIWFNGEQRGAVDLWRIPAQGGAPERMTQDAPVNWFPHPSPDGRWVLYLAYRAGTTQHPPDVHVTLRLMPADGGPSRVLTALWGGQGTLNVPCWAPDSRSFAYVRYHVAAA